MEFIKYQHVERFGTDQTEHIELGECYVFPKLDGTNASVWMAEGRLCFGSRNRRLSLDADNAGFMSWGVTSVALLDYFKGNYILNSRAHFLRRLTFFFFAAGLGFGR